MIGIKNTQRSIKINVPQLKKNIQRVLNQLDYADFDIGVWFTTNATIKKYNKQYRHQDKATDVLSFPYHPELKAGQSITAQSSDDKNLGDIIISPERVAADAHQMNIDFQRRLAVVLVHGICHLLGYDHVTDRQYQKMQAEEDRLLKLFDSQK